LHSDVGDQEQSSAATDPSGIRFVAEAVVCLVGADVIAQRRKQ